MVLVRKTEGKKPLGKPRHSLVDNIQIDLKGDTMGWSGLY
jgi:hypothetical protein